MKKLIHIDEKRKNESLGWAIERGTPCVITSRTESGWRTAKANFVAGEPQGGRLVLSLYAADPGAPGYQRGEQVGLTFRRGHKKCMCATVVLAAGGDSAQAEKDAPLVELQWPEDLQELQRRVYHRATPSRRVHVRFWRGGVAKRGAAEDGGEGVFFGTLLDLSAGGMRIKTTDLSEDLFTDGQSMGCAFTPKPRSDAIILDATYRHVQREADGSVSVGLQFVGLETSARGRATLADLARIVTEFQRGYGHHARPALAGPGPRA